MKYGLLILFALLVHLANGQHITVNVTVNKTSYIFFNSKIVRGDFGSDDYMVKPSGDKAIKLFAKNPDVAPTNMMVETRNGFYLFNLNYKPTIEKYHYSMSHEKAAHAKNKMDSVKTTVNKREKEVGQPIKINCQKIIKEDRNYTSIGMVKDRVVVSIPGIFVKGDYLYLKLKLENQSHIRYDMEYIRFAEKITGKKKMKQSVSQEQAIQPVYEYNEDINNILGEDYIQKVFVFEKFTISNDKDFLLEIGERNGDRDLKITIEKKDILHARQIG